MDYLVQATHLLKERDDIELVMFGQIKGKNSEMIDFGLPVHRLGYIHDEATLVSMYQAADVLVVPSLEDNLPNQIMEAMACGTPCVGFAVGGIPEMIMHCSTGYVAKYRSAQDLAEGIQAVIDTSDSTFLRNRVREFAENNYAESTVASQYIAVYESYLRQREERCE
jgi:Glycosyltransferase